MGTHGHAAETRYTHHLATCGLMGYICYEAQLNTVLATRQLGASFATLLRNWRRVANTVAGALQVGGTKQSLASASARLLVDNPADA